MAIRPVSQTLGTRIANRAQTPKMAYFATALGGEAEIFTVGRDDRVLSSIPDEPAVAHTHYLLGDEGRSSKVWWANALDLHQEAHNPPA
jgi:hypothetical protein